MKTNICGIGLLNEANILTVSRIILTVVFLALVQIRNPNYLFISWVVFIIAAVTDFYDGRFARKRKIVTTFGIIADPVADKILIISSLYILSYYDIVPWWMTVVISLREIGMTIFRFYLIFKQNIVLPAGSLGKWKTTFQFIAIIYSLFALLLMEYFVRFLPKFEKLFTSKFLTFLLPNLLMSVAVFFTIWSGYDYIKEYWKGNLAAKIEKQ